MERTGRQGTGRFRIIIHPFPRGPANREEVAGRITIKIVVFVDLRGRWLIKPGVLRTVISLAIKLNKIRRIKLGVSLPFDVNGLLHTAMKNFDTGGVDGSHGKSCGLQIGIGKPVDTFLRDGNFEVGLAKINPLVAHLGIR